VLLVPCYLGSKYALVGAYCRDFRYHPGMLEELQCLKIFLDKMIHFFCVFPSFLVVPGVVGSMLFKQ